MTSLSLSSLPALPQAIARPAYDPQAVSTGIVHFGPGAFHRAHQADYVDRLLADDPRWGIAAVSLRSGGTVEALARQDGLYTLAVLDAEPSWRVVGPHREWIGPGGEAGLVRRLGDPGVRLITSTVTEKGYCLAADGTLDFGHPDIRHDLTPDAPPRSLIGWIVRGLEARRAAGVAPFTVLCCDNMTGNGRKLGAAVAALARESDPGLADWIAGEVRFPNTMVDSITPASDPAFLADIESRLGFADHAAVKREAFTQWVIEDLPGSTLPDFASVGATLTGDVASWEKAKLRILNGSHSTLAYLGLLRGHEVVADAMKDEALAGFVARMVREDIVPTLPPSPGLDLAAYADAVFARFRNPAIAHKLSQIAWDGSQKLPYRLLDTLAQARAAGRPIHRLATAAAAWIAFVVARTRAGEEIVDPHAAMLAELAGGDDIRAIAGALLDAGLVFPATIAGDAEVRAAIIGAAERLAARNFDDLRG